MQRPEIRHCFLANELLIDFIRFFPLAKPGAAIHAVGHGPPGGFVAAQIQRFARGLHPVGVGGIDQRAGIEGTEV